MNAKLVKLIAGNIAGYEKMTLDRIALFSATREEWKSATASMEKADKEKFAKAIATELEKGHKIPSQRVSELLVSFGMRRRAAGRETGAKIADDIINAIVELAEKLAPRQESVALYRAWVKKKEEKKAAKKPAASK